MKKRVLWLNTPANRPRLVEITHETFVDSSGNSQHNVALGTLSGEPVRLLRPPPPRLLPDLCVPRQQAHSQNKQGWTWALAITALIYNPIIRVHLTREIWSIINLATIALVIASAVALKSPLKGP